jgi:hypothetical protein
VHVCLSSRLTLAIGNIDADGDSIWSSIAAGIARGNGVRRRRHFEELCLRRRHECRCLVEEGFIWLVDSSVGALVTREVGT